MTPLGPTRGPALERITVSPHASLADTVACIDAGAAQVALVVDTDGRLVGTVTDGDVRRGILAGVTLDTPIENVMNRRPVTAPEATPGSDVLATMRRRRIHQIPLVDDAGRLVGLRIIDDLLERTPRHNRVVILAGGRGTRLMPLTNEVPKPLLPVGDRPIVERIIETCRDAGFQRVTLALNYRADLFRDHFGDGSRLGIDVDYLVEDEPRGTAGALSLLDDLPDQPILVMNGDVLTSLSFSHLFDYHTDHGADATMCVREYEHIVPFGVVSVDGHELTGLDEKPSLRFFVNAGIYVIAPSVLKLVPRSGRYDMPELFAKLRADGRPTSAFPIREYWLDVGRHPDLERARADANDVFGK